MGSRDIISPIIDDVQKQYSTYRKSGKSRTTAIELIRKDYAQELRDEDDRLAVLVGLSLSLCKKKELYESLATETLREIRHAYRRDTWDNATFTYFEEVENSIKKESVYGKEALYKQTPIYVPDWKIGDLFSHTLTYPASEELGIKGWVILLYKVGEYVDEFEVHRQLMYVSLCPPDKVPSCDKDIQKLLFLRMMQLGDRSEYLAQITLKNKRNETAYGLTKIGHYPNIPHPNDHFEENPLTAMPLLGRVGRNDPWPGYEDQICRLYNKFGQLP